MAWLLALAAVVVFAMGGGSGAPGNASTDCPTVSFKTKIATAQGIAALIAWARVWTPKPDAQALDAVIDLMRRLQPQCRWAEDTVTRIEREDGTIFMWSEIVEAIRGKTLTEASEALKSLLPPPPGLDTAPMPGSPLDIAAIARGLLQGRA